MVITPQLLSTHYKKFGKTDYENVKAILLDEGHYMYWGPETSKIISVFLEDESRIVLAFTATPTNELTDSLGILVYHYHSLKAMERGILANNLKIRVYDTIIDIDTNRDHFNRLAIDDRARKYAEEIMKILEEEVRESGYSLQERIPKTLVVSANVSEAEMIFNKLLEFIEELGEHSKLEKDDFRKTHFIGCAHYKMGPSNEEAKKNIDEFKRSDGGILVTVNMADMGFDDRNLEVLVMARRIKTPVAYVQIRGRVLRKCDTNDPRNIKRQKGYAVLVDLARSAEEHEKKEIIEQVEEGGFSSQGVYADLAGILEKEGVREIEANVEVKPLRTFSVRESESENHIFEDEKKKVKQRMQLFNQLIRIKYEFALYKARELIMRELALMREIVMVKQEIEEECGECKKCEKSEKAKELIDKVMKEKVHIDQILDALAKNAMEQGCSAAFLNLNLTLDLKLLQLLEDLYKQLMKKMEPKEAMPARTLPIPSYNNTVRPHAPKGDELYPSLCPKCGSNAKGSTESLTDREWRRLNECPECKTHFIEKYEKRGSQWALVSKEILRNSELL
jgi:superfamily II DNA or RNA helicase